MKAYLNWATRKKYNTKLDFKDFPRSREEVDFIILKEDELFKIYRHDFTEKTDKNFELVRDVFCFTCFTGLRYSDLKGLKQENIVNGSTHLIIKMQKTRRNVKVPLNQYAKEILKKYEDDENGEYCFEVFQNPVMNRYLKEIGEMLAINDTTTLTSFRGGQKIEDTQPKYKFITCHTARRTFITLSLQKGMRQEVVMKIVGQKDIRTMMKYVKLVEDVLDEEMDKAWGISFKKLKVVDSVVHERFGII